MDIDTALARPVMLFFPGKDCANKITALQIKLLKFYRQVLDFFAPAPPVLF